MNIIDVVLRYIHACYIKSISHFDGVNVNRHAAYSNVQTDIFLIVKQNHECGQFIQINLHLSAGTLMVLQIYLRLTFINYSHRNYRDVAISGIRCR